MDGPGRNISNLTARVATAAIGIPIVIGINSLGGPAFAAVIGLTAAVTAWECARLLASTGAHPLYIVSLPAAVSLAVMPLWLPNPQAAWIGILVLSFSLTGTYYLSPHAYSNTGPVWLYSLFPPFFAGVLLGLLHLLRHTAHGAWWVLLVLIMTWAYDTGAYFAGTLFGKHPFMEHVSSKKTVEGVVGGLIAASLAGLVGILALGLAPWQSLLLGLVTGVVAQIGDLFESMLKRQAGVKDSGKLIPGHGGLLDRIDGLLLTGALGYYASTLLGHGS